jgi:GTP-binding protein
MDADAVIIPFSAETKQGREEIWALIDSLVPQEDADREAQHLESKCGGNTAGANESSGAHQTENGESGSAAGADHAGTGGNGSAAGEKVRKPRWKNTDRPVAKKTLKKAKAKKRK